MNANELKYKVYQMFILGLDGKKLSENPNLIDALENNLGGVIFFTQNIKTKEQFKTLIKDIKSEAKTPPFLSIDQEGGRVERTENLSGGKMYLSAKFSAEKGECFLKKQTEKISRELKDFGINLNFAPCVDVNTNPNNPIIGERSFSDNADEVIKCANIVVKTYLENGIIPCTKHFPGHGDASVDSHIALPEIDLPLDDYYKNHIRVFKEVSSPMIMVAHLHCKAFDKEAIPSSLSRNVVGYLINELNYKGLIITDDMVMGGVKMHRCIDAKMHSKSTEHAIEAINAGVDILLYRNSFDETIQIIENIAKSAQNEPKLLENIEKSYKKITDFKLKNKSIFYNNSIQII